MAVYALTLFASAFLLFGVQPLMGKFALPWFGGGPAVWNACMLFFQSALLLGYGYAHLSVRRWSVGRQARIHLWFVAAVVLGLLARSLVGSPLVPSDLWRDASTANPVWRVCGMLAVSAGPPFLLLAASAPLLQSWFSRERPNHSPYWLYAVSNAGSLMALLAYPTVVERWLSRTAQSWAWSAGFLGVAAALALIAWRLQLRQVPAPPSEAPAAPRPGLRQVALWLLLSFCAAALLLATTHQVTEEVALGPFLWVIPLGLYLVTFVLCFEREAWYPRWWVFGLFALALWPATYLAYQAGVAAYWLEVAGFMAVLFLGAMVCHGELYRLRPAPEHLSAFYLWISLGGVLASLFVNVAAPVLFRSYAEYPLAVLACALVAALVAVRTRKRALVGLAFLLLFSAGVRALAWTDMLGKSLWMSRNFFGVVRVVEFAPGKPEHRYALLHGQTTHGEQYLSLRADRQAWTYFGPHSGVWRAVDARRWAQGGGGLNLGVLGLGTGTLAALAAPQDTLRFFEIDPQVVALARGEGGFFRYLSGSAGTIDVVEGDARLGLESEQERNAPRYDVLVLDVFTGDAVPAHLLTDEAMALYRARLAPGGVLAVHVSSRYLDLLPLVARQAGLPGWRAVTVSAPKGPDEEVSLWCVLAPEGRLWQAPAFVEPGSQVSPLLPPAAPLVFSDDHNSLWPYLK